MRIVNRKEFLAMPSRTMYCKYKCMGIFGDLCIKYQSLENDWYYLTLADFDDCNDSVEFVNKLDQMEKDSKVSYPLNCDTTARDGLFEDDEMFMVYDDSDVMRMIKLLINTTG